MLVFASFAFFKDICLYLLILVNASGKWAGQTLDLLLCSGHGDLDVQDLVTVPLSWLVHDQLSFRLTEIISSTEGEAELGRPTPGDFMNPDGFLNALGAVPKQAWLLILLRLLLPCSIRGWGGPSTRSLLNTESQLAGTGWMKQRGRQLELEEMEVWCRLRTCARALCRGSDGGEKVFFLCHHCVRSLIYPATPEDRGEHCDQFAMHFADKIDQIQMDLDSGSGLQNLDTPRAPSGPVLGREFVLFFTCGCR